MVKIHTVCRNNPSRLMRMTLDGPTFLAKRARGAETRNTTLDKQVL